MLTETITHWAVTILETTGYAGAAGLMALESMVAPVPSEAVMPFVGFMVADGKWSAGASIVATTTGSVIGSLLSYWMGYYGGKPLVLKLGRYLLLNVHDLELTEQFFHRRSGAAAVFVARFIPVIRHFISVPAGMGRMPLGQFLLISGVGATLWNGFLLICGIKLRDHWGVVQQYSHFFDAAVIVLVLAFIGIFVWQRLARIYHKQL